MGEIHHIGGAEDQHETERDQRVDGPDADAGKQQLKDEIHDKLRLGGTQRIRRKIFGLSVENEEAENVVNR